MDNKEQLVGLYFRLGFSNRDIMECLAFGHGIVVSSRSVKRLTKNLGLFRRKGHTNIVEVAIYILDQIKNSTGCMHGYRWMHLRSIQHGFVVSQKTVRLIMGIVDPEGMDIRRRRRLRRRNYSNPGPNAVWHIDGCDKLAPYGIYIHGCIDGFSRYVIWMNANYTNKDPSVIAGYYTEKVEVIKCPLVVRADRGTENGIVCEIQQFLRRNHQDRHAGDKSYGRSTANQRIEWYWGLNRKKGIQHWMNIFQQLKENGYFSGDTLDKCLIQFCFIRLVQKTLDDIKQVWNSHKLQNNRNQIGPTGRPMIMYTMPQMYITTNYSQEVDVDDLGQCRDRCTFRRSPTSNQAVSSLCQFLIKDYAIELPDNPEDGCELYLFLRKEISELLANVA